MNWSGTIPVLDHRYVPYDLVVCSTGNGPLMAASDELAAVFALGDCPLNDHYYPRRNRVVDRG